MAEVEWEHERFFRAIVQASALSRPVPIWPAPPPLASIRESFAREAGEAERAAPPIPAR